MREKLKRTTILFVLICFAAVMLPGVSQRAYAVSDEYVMAEEPTEDESESQTEEIPVSTVVPLSPYAKTKAEYFKRFETREEFIDSVALLAVTEMEKNDILASVTIAQAMLESACGKSAAAQNRNNLFGVRAYNGNYMIYETIQESFVRHSRVMCKRRYNNSRRQVVGNHDYASVCRALTRKYAMDPKYDVKLIDLIETYDLTRFDSMTSGNFTDESNQIKILTEDDAREYVKEKLLYGSEEESRVFAKETLIDIFKHVLKDG